MLDQVLDQALANRTIAIICFVGFTVLGWIGRMIYDTVKDMFLSWREERDEKKAAPEVQEFREYFSTDTDPNLTTRRYHQAGERRTLHDGWRDFVTEIAPRSPEIVAEQIYRDTVAINRHAPAVRAEVNRPWPRWTEDEKKVVGRHRAEDRTGNLFEKSDFDALLTQTGSIPVYRKELVSA